MSSIYRFFSELGLGLSVLSDSMPLAYRPTRWLLLSIAYCNFASMQTVATGQNDHSVELTSNMGMGSIIDSFTCRIPTSVVIIIIIKMP